MKVVKVTAILAILIICGVSIFTISSFPKAENIPESSGELSEDFVVSEVTDQLIISSESSTEDEPSEISESEDSCVLTEEEIQLIALVTMAEAEGECEEGQRLVIDTILNRVDSCRFPDTVYDVVYQPWQFTSMWNGRVERCEVRDDICELVREEAEARTNSDVIFFSAGCYSDYGTPMFKVDNHYFSRET